MLVDSHCHLDRLDLARYAGGLAGALDAAAQNGVTHLLSVATDLESWPALARMTEP
ncbi:MAG: TatD family hydrolase, partial [Candidatus Competibacter sp.]|nr:TatD family hydrolase [Candidatus Competibacter sp.]